MQKIGTNTPANWESGLPPDDIEWQSPSISSSSFTHVSIRYWSGTSDAEDEDWKWAVEMGDGDTDTYFYTSTIYVWPVRSGN